MPRNLVKIIAKNSETDVMSVALLICFSCKNKKSTIIAKNKAIESGLLMYGLKRYPKRKK